MRSVAGRLLLVALTTLWACGSTESAGPDPEDDYRLVIVGGNNQSGEVGTVLSAPLTVRVAAGSTLVPGVDVSFTVTAGGGTISATSVTTDANGRAAVTMTLGSTPGDNVVRVSAPDVEGPVEFRLQATAAPPVDPILAGTYPVPATYGHHDTYVRDGIAFVSAWNAGLHILDVGGGGRGGSPSSPAVISTIVTPDAGVPGGAQVHNAWWFHNPVSGEKRYVFVGQEGPGTVGGSASGDLHVVDVSNLAAPVVVARLRIPGTGVHNFWMDEARQVLYAAWYNGGVVAVDVSGTLSGDLYSRIIARSTNSATTNEYTWGVMLSGNTLYASDMIHGLYALDPVTLAPRGLGAVNDRYTSDLWIHGTTGYSGTWGTRSAGNRGDVIRIWAIGANGVPAAAGTVTIPNISTVSDVAVTADGSTLVATAEGPNGGLYVYSLSDPRNPVLIGSVRVNTGLHTGEIAVIAGRTYVFAARNPPQPALQIYDITHLLP